VAGASNRDIAERLVISPHTAVRHVRSVAGKLGARSRGSAVARATGLDGGPGGRANAAAGASPGTG
jgi:DNA-binding CsgD family transcriptional regulator